MDDKHKEISSTPHDNNCFLTSLAEGETFLYDEAEQLLYNCSEKSFPAVFLKEEQSEWVTIAESDWEAYRVKPGSQSNIFQKNSGETRYYSLSSLRKEQTRSQFIPSTVPSRSPSGLTCPEVKDEVNPSKDSITPFERAIIQKFKEISNTSQPAVDQKLSSEEETNKEVISNMEQLYLRKSPFLVTSSADSSPKGPESPRPTGEEVFSNSDFDEAMKSPTENNSAGKDSKQVDTSDCIPNHCNTQTIAPQHRPTKKGIQSPNQSLSVSEPSQHTSQTKDSSVTTESICMPHQTNRNGSQSTDRSLSPNRPSPQSKPSMNAKTTALTPCIFVQEILKSNLVMKEDIFSTSKVKSDDSVHSFETDKKEEKEENREVPNRKVPSKEERPSVLIRNAKPRSFSPWRRVSMEEGVVYETVGERPLSKHQTERILMSDKQQPRRAPRPNQMPKDRGQERANEGDELQRKQRKEHRAQDEGHEEDAREPAVKKFVDAGVSTLTQLNDIEHSDFQDACTGPSTTKVMSKYVKLPGFPEAFGTKDCNVAELRIKDGTSFESLNAFEVLSTATKRLGTSAKVGGHRGNPTELLCEPRMKMNETIRQVLRPKIEELKDSATNCQLITKDTLCEKIVETQDASAGPQIINEDKVTQTRGMNNFLGAISTANISVQCDSRILIPNDEGTHKEIMICDDDGSGVQLYNSLGFPLTDMDGYLLKDSHGRFLVKLDPLGVPVCCTNGEAISLEDGSTWITVKGRLNVIHQSSKKNIIKKPTERRSKRRIRDNPTMAQISNAMRNLTHSLDWADKLSSLDTKSTSQNLSQVCLEPHENLSQLGQNSLRYNDDVTQPAPSAKKDTIENPSTLVAEMQSIAKLRNALLEKVNFIAVHRKTPGIVPRNGTRSLNSTEVPHARKNTGDVQWQSEPKILKNSAADSQRERKLSPSFNTKASLDDKSQTIYTWKNSVKLTSAAKPPRIQNPENLEVTLQDDTRLGDVSLVDRFFEKGQSPTRQLATGRDRSPQRKGRSPQRRDRTPQRRDRTPQRDVSRDDCHSSQLKRMENMLMKWNESRPTIDSENSNSFFR